MGEVVMILLVLSWRAAATPARTLERHHAHEPGRGLPDVRGRVGEQGEERAAEGRDGEEDPAAMGSVCCVIELFFRA